MHSTHFKTVTKSVLKTCKPGLILVNCKIPKCYYRGLLLPKVVVDKFGGSLSDIGMLGSGIYFADAARYTFFLT